MITNEEITEQITILQQKSQVHVVAQQEIQKQLTRLTGIMLQARQSVVKAIAAVTKQVPLDPKNPTGPKTVEIVKPAVPEGVETIMDVMPHIPLTDETLTEVGRKKIFDNVKSKIDSI